MSYCHSRRRTCPPDRGGQAWHRTAARGRRHARVPPHFSGIRHHGEKSRATRTNTRHKRNQRQRPNTHDNATRTHGNRTQTTLIGLAHTSRQHNKTKQKRRKRNKSDRHRPRPLPPPMSSRHLRGHCYNTRGQSRAEGVGGGASKTGGVIPQWTPRTSAPRSWPARRRPLRRRQRHQRHRRHRRRQPLRHRHRGCLRRPRRHRPPHHQS